MKQSYFKQGGMFLKGNLHCHTTVSDGCYTPQRIIEEYAGKGYDFLSVTDHNILKSHDGNGTGMVLLDGVEHDLTFSKYKNIHLVGISDIYEHIPSYDCRKYSPAEIDMQDMIDIMRADGQFVSLAHPIWSRMEPEEVAALKGFNAIEVFNRGCENLCHAGHGEVYWDMLLRRGAKVFATASDDTHKPEDLFGGWIVVNAESKTRDSIFESVFKGQYYSSSGPKIHDFGIDETKVFFNCSPCMEVHFVTYPPRGKSFFSSAQSSCGITEAEYELKGGETYIRVECIDERGKTAWTNPIFL